MAQGFASMTIERRKEVASRGGKAAHRLGKAFKFDSETARKATLIAWQNKSKKKGDERESQNTGEQVELGSSNPTPFTKYALEYRKSQMNGSF